MAFGPLYTHLSTSLRCTIRTAFYGFSHHNALQLLHIDQVGLDCQRHIVAGPTARSTSQHIHLARAYFPALSPESRRATGAGMRRPWAEVISHRLRELREPGAGAHAARFSQTARDALGRNRRWEALWPTTADLSRRCVRGWGSRGRGFRSRRPDLFSQARAYFVAVRDGSGDHSEALSFTSSE